jgi:hypothetical protein
MEWKQRFRPGLLQVRECELTLPRAVLQGTFAGVMFVAGLILLTGIPTQQFVYFQF